MSDREFTGLKTTGSAIIKGMEVDHENLEVTLKLNGGRVQNNFDGTAKLVLTKDALTVLSDINRVLAKEEYIAENAGRYTDVDLTTEQVAKLAADVIRMEDKYGYDEEEAIQAVFDSTDLGEDIER